MQDFALCHSDFLDLEVKQSTIPSIGRGLFVKNTFHTGDIISECRGTIIKKSSCDEDFFKFEGRLSYISEEIAMVGDY